MSKFQKIIILAICIFLLIYGTNSYFNFKTQQNLNKIISSGQLNVGGYVNVMGDIDAKVSGDVDANVSGDIDASIYR